MDEYLQPYEHLRIPLEEITLATNNFNNENCIGGGGFGKVYKGEVSHYKGRSLVAIKRLDPTRGQGMPEFIKEITMLSDYKHKNLISLLGFCCERREMILVYEHASRGSLDNHLNSPHLTWIQRLNICLDAAKGLSYLHDPRDTHQRLIHCDMKSGNILLDDHWNAKVSDFGLAIMGPANELHSVIITLAAGTHGYCDPQYAMTHTLTKESDIYSFGVVLFEVLCGRLCCTYRNGRVQQNFVPNWIESYKQKNLNDIIFKDPSVQPLCHSSLKTFTDIAYRCLNVSRKDRPNMAEVVIELETALSCQEFSIKFFDYEKMTKTAVPPLNYSSSDELLKLLSKGVLLNDGKKWFSLNKKREHNEMISIAECLDSGSSESESSLWSSEYSSRFVVGTYPYKTPDGGPYTEETYIEAFTLKTRVKTQFLSPGVTYTVNLVFNVDDSYDRRYSDFSIRYKLQGETKTSISYLASEREDGWLMWELYQFTSDQSIVDLQILFEGYGDGMYGVIYLEGIEFCPLEKVECKDEKSPVLHSDAKWEEKVPTNYENIMKWSTNSLHWKTKKEAYSIIRKGFLISDGQKWFSLDNNGKYCPMISARALGLYEESCFNDYMLSLPESRFGEGLELVMEDFTINNDIESQLLSSETTYATYLVYKLLKDQSKFEAPLKLCSGGVVEEDWFDFCWYIYLSSPQTPVIRPKADQSTQNPHSRPNVKGVPKQRDDGWMEVQFWEFRTGTTTKKINMCLDFFNHGSESLEGLLIEGVEFRPI